MGRLDLNSPIQHDLLVNSDEWKRYCAIWHRPVLTGRMAHWCIDGAGDGGMPVDETCVEIKRCRCYPAAVIEEFAGRKALS